MLAKPHIYKSGDWWYCFLNVNSTIGRGHSPREAYFSWLGRTIYV